MRIATCGGLIVFAAALVQAASVQAQYPTRPIRFIVPFAAGSANDIVGRIVGPPLSEALGRPVVIDNRPGFGGNIGAELAANSPPDGYTLMMGNIAHAISVTLYSKLGYDLVRDFAPVSLLASGSFLMTVHPSVPARTVKELIALARARPGELNVATSGAGVFLASELFHNIAGVKMTNVTYRSTPQAITALVSGEVSVGFPGTSAAVPHVRSAKLRGLAVTSARRSPMAPDVPTIAEAGVPGYEASPWYGLMVPSRTPTEIISRLHAESVKALARPDVKERFGTTDFQLIGGAPEQFGTHIRSEIEKWGKIVKATGLRPD
ncbi:MAG: Bug family tripartite tricarboxylate transporter substrate binding protein [Burkholderiales bacterium]